MSKSNYQLVEKAERGVAPRIVTVKHVAKTATNEAYNEVEFKRGDDQQHYIGSTIDETKRGWTLETVQFTGSAVTMFFPRNRFTKIESK